MLSELQLDSRAALLINRSLGLTMDSFEAETETAVASLTKIMTALVVLEKRQLDETVTITPEMLMGLEGYAKIGLMVGQTVTVKDLLYATMLPSAGDAAQALAISTAGSIAEFAEWMNVRAAEIGLAHTHFSNAVGIDEAENYSTPADIAKLVETALGNEQFRELFASFEQYLPSLGVTVRKTFAQWGPVWGGKTGYTDDAGRCLASVAQIEGTEYLLVTIGANPGQNVHDAEVVYQYIADYYEPLEILSAGQMLVRLPVKGSQTKVLELTAPDTITVALPNGTARTELDYEYTGVTEITRRLTPGQVLGEFSVRAGEDILYTAQLSYTTKVEFYHYGWVGVGGLMSLVLFVLTVLMGLRTRRRGGKKWRKWFGVGVGLTLLSLVLNWWVFGKWFAPLAEMEVYQPVAAMTSEVPLPETAETVAPAEEEEEPEIPTETPVAGNCTTGWGNLMLINPNFTVSTEYIAGRRQDLISLSQTYGVQEYHYDRNGDNLLMPVAARAMAAMVQAYREAYPGHVMGTYSCFRSRGTSCGRLCAATGASDHHTGLTCDLIDQTYGTELDTDDYPRHLEWQWLRENSYKYGFIDRFPEAWAGGSMLEPLNVNGEGSTGLFETWHYRYVGVETATEIATGKYNQGEYDSLEHYLKVTGRIADLKQGICAL